MYRYTRARYGSSVLFDLKATPAPVSRMEFQEKRFIRRALSRLARRLERFVGGQLINKSWKEGGEYGVRVRERRALGETGKRRTRMGTNGWYKRMEYYTIVSYRPAETPHLQFKRERYSRVVNEELVAVFLDADTLAGDFGTVDGHQVRIPRLEPPTVPFLRERAT